MQGIHLVPSELKKKETAFLSEISGFHGCEYEDDCLLGCCAV
jgi:hypothetical protein